MLLVLWSKETHIGSGLRLWQCAKLIGKYQCCQHALHHLLSTDIMEIQNNPNYNTISELQNKRGFLHCQPEQYTIQCATGLKNYTCLSILWFSPHWGQYKHFRMQTTSHCSFSILSFFERCSILSLSRVLELSDAQLQQRSSRKFDKSRQKFFAALNVALHRNRYIMVYPISLSLNSDGDSSTFCRRGPEALRLWKKKLSLTPHSNNMSTYHEVWIHPHLVSLWIYSTHFVFGFFPHLGSTAMFHTMSQDSQDVFPAPAVFCQEASTRILQTFCPPTMHKAWIHSTGSKTNSKSAGAQGRTSPPCLE